MPGVVVDGNDVIAVHDAAAEAAARARRGGGPTLLVCRTFRSLFHAMRNAPPPETRPAELLADWKTRDPIDRFESDLRAREIVSDSSLGDIRAEVQTNLEAAVAFADASPFPDPKDLLVDM